MTPVLTIQQAADLLSLSPQRVRELIRSGQITATATTEVGYRISMSEIMRFAVLPRRPGRPKKQ